MATSAVSAGTKLLRAVPAVSVCSPLKSCHCFLSMWTQSRHRTLEKSTKRSSMKKLRVLCQKCGRAALYPTHRRQLLHIALLLLLFLLHAALLVVSSSIVRHTRNFFGFGEDAEKDQTLVSLGLNRDFASRNLSEDNPLLWRVPWGREEDYRMGKKLGSGAYGKVYLSRHLPTNSSVAIKVLSPVKRRKVVREMRAMLDLRHPNIIQFNDAFVEHSSNWVCLVLEALEDAEQLGTFRVPPEDIQHYVKSMLSALALAERKRWMHRDISPENVMVNQESKHLTVIDWGLARMVSEGGQSSFIGNCHYTAPELFLGVEEYDGAVDVWSVGVFFAEWLLCYPKGANLFEDDDGSCEMNVLLSQGKILGSRSLFEYLEEHELFMPPWAVVELGDSDRQSWESLRNENCDVTLSEAAYDLLDNLLAFDPDKRLSASQALKHQYFKT